ncbi:CBS domain-containing protein [Cryobacterium sp. M15]|jgi:CBS domain-containing protein/sporulation protein YlmC with PRC-barrel domain|uniref:CBS domain-containing protein n=1 Tax=Cryobacterium sp. M15 TaxID=2048291 RepID=UPI0035173351
MTTAREIMTYGAECIGENETLADAARRLRDLDIGSMPICGEDNRLKGMLTDRDIVVFGIAEGRDPATTIAADLAQGKPVTIGADDDVSEALVTMKAHKVRRLPVIDGHDLVGMLTQADVARSLSDDRVGDLVEYISQSDISASDPSNKLTRGEGTVDSPDSWMLVKLSESDETIAREDEDIRGRAVKDKVGSDIGKIDDLLIDETERKVRFIEVASGGFLGIGRDKAFIPIDAIVAITDNEVQIDQIREFVASAPAYDPDLVREREYYGGVLGYYGYGPFWGADYRYPDYPNYR